MKRIILLISLVVLLVGCSGAAPQATKVSEAAVQPAAASLDNYVASDPAMISSTGRPQVIEFFAFWCTTCQAMRPVIHGLQDRYRDKVDFIYLDIDAANTKDLQKTLGFTGLRPTLIFVTPEGTEMDRLVGVQASDQIAQKIDALMGGAG